MLVALASVGLLAQAGAGARAPGQPASGSIRTTVSDELGEARRLTADGKVSDALAVYARVLAADARQPEALAYQGLLIALGGSSTEGLASIDRALAADPSYPEARLFRGLVLVGTDRAGAAAEFRAALADRPTSAVAAAAQAALDKVSAGDTPAAAGPVAP